MKPYVFGHRGASGYEIENTILAFNKAVEMGAGIESDVQLTIDNRLICFHDSYIKRQGKISLIKDFTLSELRAIKFNDNRKIPLVEEVFENFQNAPKTFRYSFDVINKNSGLELLNLAKKASLLDNLEITDRRISVLSALRAEYESSKLVYTLSDSVKSINLKTKDLEKLKELKVDIINIQVKRYFAELFKDIIDNGFKCYVYGVNTGLNMKKIVKLRYKDEIVEAIYTNYPDKLHHILKTNI